MPQGECYKFNLFLLSCSVLCFISLPDSFSFPLRPFRHPSLHSCRQPEITSLSPFHPPFLSPPLHPPFHFSSSLSIHLSIAIPSFKPTPVWQSHYCLISVWQAVYLPPSVSSPLSLHTETNRWHVGLSFCAFACVCSRRSHFRRLCQWNDISAFYSCH